MPSPQYYQSVWEIGWEGAARGCLQSLAAHLRERSQSLSSADLIAAWNSALMLQRVRGHRQLGRVDLLDGLVGALVKEALESPLPWSYRGQLQDSTHPVLLALVEVFSGTRRGRLDPATPRPALAQEVQQQLLQHDLVPTHPPRLRKVQAGSSASHVLHRLQLLSISGFQRLREDPEEWSLAETLEFEASLLEAASLGNTLEEAAVQALERRILPDSAASEVGVLLAEASRAGLLNLCRRWLDRLAPALRNERHLAELVDALISLDLSARVCLELAESARQLIGDGLERALWLLEGGGAELGPVVGLRDLLRRYPSAGAQGVLERVARGASTVLRGAALGALWSLCGGSQSSLVVAVRGVYPPEDLGDFLHGLFCLARESVLEQAELLEELHRLVLDLEAEAFLRALPALRLAFERFPPAEKQQLALLLLPQLGLTHPSQLLRSSLSPQLTRQAAELDHRVEAEARRLGW